MAAVIARTGCSGVKAGGCPAQTYLFRRAFRTNVRRFKEAAAEAEVVGTPYTKLTLGVPKETWSGERRVAISPAVTAALTKKGFKMSNVKSVFFRELHIQPLSHPNTSYQNYLFFVTFQQ